jgi:hypothetical protein
MRKTVLITLTFLILLYVVVLFGLQFGHDMAQKAHHELASINQQQAPVEQPTKSEFNLPVDKRVP